MLFDVLSSPQPWNEASVYKALKRGSHNRTYRNGDTNFVLKLFDREERVFLPNKQLLELAGLNVLVEQNEFHIFDLTGGTLYFHLHTRTNEFHTCD
jgi:hypothetical protein